MFLSVLSIKNQNNPFVTQVLLYICSISLPVLLQENLSVEDLMKLPYPGKGSLTFEEAIALTVGKLSYLISSLYL